MISGASRSPCTSPGHGGQYFHDRGTFTLLPVIFLLALRRVKRVTWEIELNKLFDISHPGRFKIQAVRRDLQTNTIVKSNSIKLKVTH